MSTMKHWEDSERQLLAHYVTDVDGPIYAIHGLPEEVIAVIFAYVSRSSRSFRENLVKLLREDLAVYTAPGDESSAGSETTRDGADPGGLVYASQEAARFHEKWVVGYGHASVSEHAVIHLGIEGVSRLASAELELANPFLSFTEYSQRYQEPKRGAWVCPPELETEAERNRFAEAMEQLYAVYQALLMGMSAYYRQQQTPAPIGDGSAASDDEQRQERQARRRAFEDARYALPLATATQLGMTANARALRDALRRLLCSPYGEVRQMAERLRDQALRVTPTLLRHAEADEGWERARVALPGSHVTGSSAASASPASSTPVVRLLDAWPADPAEAAYQLSGIEDEAAQTALVRAGTALGPFNEPPASLHGVIYRFDVLLSEAAWHQLLRHARQASMFPSPPGDAYGWVTPPVVATAGLRERLAEAAMVSRQALSSLGGSLRPVLQPYLTLNAHRRHVVVQVDLWELIHLVHQRTTAEAQWEIRQAVQEMGAAAAAVHPFLTRFSAWEEALGTMAQAEEEV